jgi:hypothetical protein
VGKRNAQGEALSVRGEAVAGGEKEGAAGVIGAVKRVNGSACPAGNSTTGSQEGKSSRPPRSGLVQRCSSDARAASAMSIPRGTRMAAPVICSIWFAAHYHPATAFSLPMQHDGQDFMLSRRRSRCDDVAHADARPERCPVAGCLLPAARRPRGGSSRHTESRPCRR